MSDYKDPALFVQEITDEKGPAQRPGDLAVFLRAARFAEQAHAGQTRKRSKDPYFLHCLRVAYMAADHEPSMPYEILAGLVMHDVVEDTRFTRRDIAERFPHSTLMLVSDLTRGLAEPKDEYLERVFCHSSCTWSPVGKLCDRIDNLTDRWFTADKAWQKRYLASSLRILDHARATGYGDCPSAVILETVIRERYHV